MAGEVTISALLDGFSRADDGGSARQQDENGASIRMRNTLPSPNKRQSTIRHDSKFSSKLSRHTQRPIGSPHPQVIS
jgi:hypothetical protein